MSDARLPASEKAEVARRARFCCEYCLSQACFAPDPFSVEHIHPRAQGGTNDLQNLALACQGCNSRKYTSVEAIDPVSGANVPLFHPRRQSWKAHFAWNEDFTLVIGLSAVGRATIEKLQLNRESLINLRRVLHQAGFHPPQE